MERYAVFNPATGEVLSLPNYKPTEGSYIEVDPEDVKGILTGQEPMSYYYVHLSKRTKKYELRLRLNNNIDSYNVNDLIYEVPKRKKANADITITQNIKDTCWKVQVGGDLKANIFAQKVSLNNAISFSITKVNDPNILYKTLQLDFAKLENNKYAIIPFTADFEFLGEPISIYTMKKFDKYYYEVIN